MKTLAAKNTSTLNRTHLITLAIHATYLLCSLLLFRRRYRFLPYILCALPALGIEIYFERLARPTFSANGDLKRAGEDLEAKGLTEWMWDVLYWTWGCIVLVTLAGNWAWWLYAAVPVYTVYSLFGTYSKVKGGMGGLMGQGQGVEESSGQSKRQAKMEKRGGQKVQYR